jgi:hypothetical protein
VAIPILIILLAIFLNDIATSFKRNFETVGDKGRGLETKIQHAMTEYEQRRTEGNGIVSGKYN